MSLNFLTKSKHLYLENDVNEKPEKEAAQQEVAENISPGLVPLSLSKM